MTRRFAETPPHPLRPPVPDQPRIWLRCRESSPCSLAHRSTALRSVSYELARRAQWQRIYRAPEMHRSPECLSSLAPILDNYIPVHMIRQRPDICLKRTIFFTEAAVRV